MQDSKPVLLTTAYLPNIQYFSKILGCSEVCIEVHENYQKQSYRNRAIILGANGPLDLIIPVKKTNGNNTPTRDILIDYDTPWQPVHKKAILSAYNHSPFFEIFEPELNPVFDRQEKYLLDWNFYILDTLLEIIGREKVYTQTANYVEANSTNFFDFREIIHPKARLQKPDTNFRPLPYFQVFSEKFGFQPNLSFIDLLFNEGSDAAFHCLRCIPNGH